MTGYSPLFNIDTIYSMTFIYSLPQIHYLVQVIQPLRSKIVTQLLKVQVSIGSFRKAVVMEHLPPIPQAHPSTTKH